VTYGSAEEVNSAIRSLDGVVSMWITLLCKVNFSFFIYEFTCQILIYKVTVI
jgi:hypothetical protein